jgi:hypothetical protein
MQRLLPILAAGLLWFLPVAGGAQDKPAEGLQVAEAKLGKGVQDRQITEESTAFALNEKAYLWLRVTGGPSDPIKVTWKVGDSTDAVELKIGGNPWRTWSSKTLWKAGEWSVTVTSASGEVLKELTFTVQ